MFSSLRRLRGLTKRRVMGLGEVSVWERHASPMRRILNRPTRSYGRATWPLILIRPGICIREPTTRTECIRSDGETFLFHRVRIAHCFGTELERALSI